MVDWITSVQEQQILINHIAGTQKIDDTFLQTHILASLPKEYNSLVDAAKVSLRQGHLKVTDLIKLLKELYTRLKSKTSGQMIRL